MREGDVQAASDLANAVHLAYPEDVQVVRDRLSLYPQGCLVLDGEPGLLGYLLCHPWRIGPPPALNTALGDLPPDPDCLYLHDIALLEPARGHGHAASALKIVKTLAGSAGLPAVLLTAVGDANRFWERAGFTRFDGPTGYGAEAAAYLLRL